MKGSTERPLKVLTAKFAERLQVFNSAARTLQAMGIRLLSVESQENRLQISPADGKRLLSLRVTEGYQRHASAGSTRYVVMFQGVTLEWREPISYRDLTPVDLTFH